MAPRLTLKRWQELRAPERRAVGRRLSAALGDAFELLGGLVASEELVAIRHIETDTELVLVPGGRCAMGVSAAELEEVARLCPVGWDHVDEMASARPQHLVSVAPFLLARSLVSETASVRSKRLPRLCSAANARRVAADNQMRLPSEAEWEFVAREGGVASWIGVKPGARSIVKSIDRACRAVYGKAFSPTAKPPTTNSFGVWGLVLGSWVADGWHTTYRGAPRTSKAWAAEASPRVRRGGAGALWPWQDDGAHIEAHCAFRCEAGRGDESFVRLALDLPARFDWTRGPEAAATKKPAAARTSKLKGPKATPRHKKPKTPGQRSALNAAIVERAVQALVPPGSQVQGKRVSCFRLGPSAFQASIFVVWRAPRHKRDSTATVRATGPDAVGALEALLHKIDA